MIKKLLLVSVLAAIAGSNSYATEMYKAKLLSHKETTTGNVVASFKQIKGKSLTRSSKFRHSTNQHTAGSDVISITNRMHEAHGFTNHSQSDDLTLVKGFSAVWLFNDTDAEQQYSVQTKICTQGDLERAVLFCATSTEEYMVEPTGSVFSLTMPVISYGYPTAGDYYTSIDTYVRKDNQTTIFTSYDDNIAQITD